MKSRYSGEASITVKRNVDKILLILSIPSIGEVELALSLSEARRLGKLLMSYSEAGVVQMDLLLRKLSDIERTVSSIIERVRSLESRVGGSYQQGQSS